MAVAVGTLLLTPLGHPVNVLVMGSGESSASRLAVDGAVVHRRARILTVLLAAAVSRLIRRKRKAS